MRSFVDNRQQKQKGKIMPFTHTAKNLYLTLLRKIYFYLFGILISRSILKSGWFTTKGAWGL